MHPPSYPSQPQFAWLVFLLIAFGALAISTELTAQCAPQISIFPYQEDFETNQGGWTSGGTDNDWAWGAPNKPTINSAASGNNCWVTGGLTGSFYNFGERSYVESPCFDFASLTHPYIFFKIWWESERQYDGANFQYSLNGGTTWTNVGSASDAKDCLNENWFNSSSITHLSNLATVRDGWAGNIKPTVGSCLGGNGSNSWVTARHCMPYLAGNTSVKFRFTFGAGTTCNDFDGIAFDDIHIENAPAIVANFSYTCLGPDTIAFTNLSSLCPDTWSWNFDDSASGPFNTTVVENPIHVFSTPGVYTVTLQASSACTPGSTISQTITVAGIDFNSIPVDCAGNSSGSATAQVTPAGGTPNFIWSTSPPQSGATASNLPAGIYTVTVTSTTACPSTASVTIGQPAPLQHTVTTVPAFCGNPTGAATIQESGGIGPYTFSWSPAVATGNSAGNLAASQYFVSVQDQNGCLDTVQLEIPNAQIQAALDQVQPASCFGIPDGSIRVVPVAGVGPFSYAWSPMVGTGAMVSGLAAGDYTLTVSDANNCTTSLTATISQPAELSAVVSADAALCFGDATGVIRIDSTSGGTAPYQFALGQAPLGSLAVFAGLSPGTFLVRVEDANGCQFQETVLVTEPAPNLVLVGPDTSVYQGSLVNLTSFIPDPGRVVSYEWKPTLGLDCPTCPGTIARPPATTNYTLCATDSSGCVSAGTLTIQVEPGSVYIPNVFAPASILLNDRFTIFAGGNVDQVNSLQIYDRWGSLIFENLNFPASEPLEGWDGKYNGNLAAPGIYIYKIAVRFIDGSTEEFSGDILLFR